MSLAMPVFLALGPWHERYKYQQIHLEHSSQTPRSAGQAVTIPGGAISQVFRVLWEEAVVAAIWHAFFFVGPRSLPWLAVLLWARTFHRVESSCFGS